MAPKKKGKANKLARMSEEEKLRYLQHRAAVEEEARRRKELIISSYMKNKLKHEETFTKLNNAKINQQWRQILRGLKNKELHDATETLRQVFEIALKTKNKIIDNLLTDLNDAGKLHSLAVQTHLESLNKIINLQEDRLVTASNYYITTRDRKVIQAKTENKRIESNFKKDVEEFERALYWEKKCNENKYNELYKLGMDYRNDKMYQMMSDERNEEKIHRKKIQDLECQLKDVVQEYQEMFRPFKPHYNHLLETDTQHMQSYKRSKMLLNSYQELIDKITKRNQESNLKGEKEISCLKELLDEKKQQHNKIKKQIEIESKEADRKLNSLSIISNETIKHLQKLEVKSESISNMMKNGNKLLTEKEIVFSSFQGTPKTSELTDDDKKDIMSNFWRKYAELHVDVKNLEAHYGSYLEENAQLKHLLQQYMKTVSRPSSVPSSLVRDRSVFYCNSTRPTTCQ